MAALSNQKVADSIISHKPANSTTTTAFASHDSSHNAHQHPSAATPRSSVDHRPAEQFVRLGHASRRSHHASSASTSSLPRIVSQRSSTGNSASILARAKDRTQSAFASISEPVLRPRQSSPGLARFTNGDSLAPVSRAGHASSPSKSPSSDSLSSGEYTVAGSNPPSQAYVDTDASLPLPVRQPRSDPKMHQTSSRLLRMTDDDRPYTRVCYSSWVPSFFGWLLCACVDTSLGSCT